MLDKKHRLPKFINFVSAGALSCRQFLIRVKNNNLNVSRFAVVVSKKIDKRAVGRNKIKRQVRNCIEKLLPNIKEGKDVLIIARADVREKTEEEILLIIKESFEKAKLLK